MKWLCIFCNCVLNCDCQVNSLTIKEEIVIKMVIVMHRKFDISTEPNKVMGQLQCLNVLITTELLGGSTQNGHASKIDERALITKPTTSTS